MTTRDALKVIPRPEKHEQPCGDGPALERYREDWQLVQGCIEGDRSRWMELLEKYETTVYYAVLHTLRTRGAHYSEDLVLDLQCDILTRLVKDDFHKLSRYSGRCKLSHWLKVVASHHTIDVLRHRRPMVSLDDTSEPAKAVQRSLVSHAPRPDQALRRREQREAFWDMCAALPEADQRFIELHVRQELPFEAIAHIMETTVGAVYARKNRVRKKLIELASERGYDLQ